MHVNQDVHIYAQGVLRWDLLSAEFSALNNLNSFLQQDFLYIFSLILHKRRWWLSFYVFEFPKFLVLLKASWRLVLHRHPRRIPHFCGLHLFSERKESPEFVVLKKCFFFLILSKTSKFHSWRNELGSVAQSINCYQSSFNTQTCINYIHFKSDRALIKTLKEYGQDRLQALSMNRVVFFLHFLKH